MHQHQAPLSPTVRRFAIAACGLALVTTATGPAAAGSGGGDPPQFSWQLLDSGTEASLSSLDGVSPDVAWSASVDGVVLRTVDGGATFSDVSPPDSAEVDFLDVEASSAEDALLLSIGPAGAVIYRTHDGGASWQMPYVSTEIFFNCMAMFDRRHGFAFGDPGDTGKFQIIVTGDAGRSWELIDPAGMPDALQDEFGLAYAGNCAAATGRKAFFGTAGAEARVFRSADRGLTWQVSSTSMEFGILALDFRTNKLGLALGEDVSRTTDGGVTWQLVDEEVSPPPTAYDVAWWSDLRGDERSEITDAQRTVFTGGEGGSFVSSDRGKTWEQFSDEEFTNYECVEDTLDCWAAGLDGQIARLVVS